MITRGNVSVREGREFRGKWVSRGGWRGGHRHRRVPQGSESEISGVVGRSLPLLALCYVDSAGCKPQGISNPGGLWISILLKLLGSESFEG